MKKATEIGDFSQALIEEYAVTNLSKALLENKELDEGLLSTLLGGAAGFLVGPIIGRAIAKVLGVEKGLLFDLLTSKLVTTALGAQIANSSIPTPTPVVTKK